MSLRDYSLENPKTTGDTIWIDYNAPKDEPLQWHVGDVERALVYWGNRFGLTDVELWAIWQMYPRPDEPKLDEPEVNDELELFDAITRFTCYRKLACQRRKEEKAERKRLKKNKPVQLSLFSL